MGLCSEFIVNCLTVNTVALPVGIDHRDTVHSILMKDSTMQDSNPTEYTREAQEALHAQWKTSGQSQAAFCKEHNIPYSQFSYWHKRAKSRKLKQQPTFAAGKLIDSGARSTPLVSRLILPNGMRVDIFSEATLLTLMKDALLIV